MSSTIALTSCARKGATKTINGLVNCHVTFFEHWFDAFEVTTGLEVSTVNNSTDIGPLGVHGTRCIDYEY